ncbi:chemotaxis protein CheW [Tepiditoga spiralis]|uniref:Chemotaxis protein CheW n=1 Tax=Tepiditoga spiralis TaxID=2108365 RepID=A0A7G1G3R9_9BACT|nr:chemotaxis protein CheW [Tepiditoga spiralis]BBE30695.1 chemotaxis protein CheW [Tepiditoga spiralis]
MVDVLSFNIGDQEFAVDVDLIEVVTEIDDITPVPKSKHFINGLINLRGKIVSVSDITKILDIELPENHEYENILILKMNNEELGIFVDEVKNVLTVDNSNLENISNNITYKEKSNGIIKIDNRLIVYLNMFKVFDLENSL